MTNLTVLRTAQHAGWPSYCWPFPGNGFPLTTPSSPSSPNMANPSPCRPPSPAHLRGAPSPSQLQRLSRAYEEHFLQLTAAAAVASASHSNGNNVKIEPLSPDHQTPSNNKNICGNKDAIHSSIEKGRPKHHRSSPAQLAVSSVARDNTPSPSASPISQNSNRTKTPVSFPGTPPHPSFTPPIGLPPGCFNSSALSGLNVPSSVGLGNLTRATHFLDPPALPRNCSDLMRSLAAKYNNNNNNELYTNQMTKSFPRLGMNSLMPAKPVSSPHSSSPAEESHGDSLSTSKGSAVKIFSPFMPHSPINDMHQSPVSSHSSAKALMDLVRNTSVSATVLDTKTFPLNPSLKRYAESSSPLDLSSNDPAKRMRRDPNINATNTVLSQDNPSESRSVAGNIERNIPDVRLSPHCTSNDCKPETHCPSPKFKENRLNDPQHNHAVNNPIVHNSHQTVLKESPISDTRIVSKTNTLSLRDCAQKDEILRTTSSPFLSWTVEDVSAFVKSIDLCAEYADMFVEERIDGWCLSLLTESHLTGNLGMKLGPALKLRSLLSSLTSTENDETVNCGGCRPRSSSWNSKDVRDNGTCKPSEDGSVRDVEPNDNIVNRGAFYNNNVIHCKVSPSRHDRGLTTSSPNSGYSPRRSFDSPSTPKGKLKMSSPSPEETSKISPPSDRKCLSPT